MVLVEKVILKQDKRYKLYLYELIVIIVFITSLIFL